MGTPTKGASRDDNPALYDGDEDENLRRGPPPTPDSTDAPHNRGERAEQVDGAARGSGAGAGGGGGPEEYDSDPANGSGSFTRKLDPPRPNPASADSGAASRRDLSSQRRRVRDAGG